MRLICYIFNPLNTEFRSREKKRQFLSNVSFLDWFSASTVVSMEWLKMKSSVIVCFVFEMEVVGYAEIYL